jgi:protein Tex
VGPTRGWRRLGNRPPAPTGRARHESGAGGWATQQAENGGKEGAGRGSRAAPRKSQQAARGEKKGGGGGKGGRARVGGVRLGRGGAKSAQDERGGEGGGGGGRAGRGWAAPGEPTQERGVWGFFLFSI